MIDTSIIFRDNVRRHDSFEVGMRLQETRPFCHHLEKIIRDLDSTRATVKRRGNHEAIERMRKDIDFKIQPGDILHLSLRIRPRPALRPPLSGLPEIISHGGRARMRVEQASLTVRVS